jgi:peptidoglycan/LPS O-acetylase OafA/YrhL
MTGVDSGAEFHLQGHSSRLQSLRGLAALCVLVGHSFTVMAAGRIEDPNFTLRPTNVFLAAGEVLIQANTAVILFYVLSGFVLAESLRRRRASSELRHVFGFATRRLWRLLPVMWISIAFAAVVVLIFNHPPYARATGWFNGQLDIPITFESLVLNFLGLSHSINSVLWSIQIELAIIPLLPLAVWVSRGRPLWFDVAVTAALCAVTIIFWERAPNFVLYAYCFYLGVALPKLMASTNAIRILGNGWCVLVALAVLVPIEYLYVSLRLWLVYKFFFDAAICVLIIAFVMLRPDCRPAQMLDHRALVWLGDVSYSLYAFGMAILIIFASIALRIVPENWIGEDLLETALTVAIAVISVAACAALARLSFDYVERPCIAVGRYLSDTVNCSRSAVGSFANASDAVAEVP